MLYKVQELTLMKLSLTHKQGDTDMISDQKIAKEQVAVFDNSADVSDLAIGNSRIGIGLIMFMAGFVGVWGCICLLSGIVQSQNLQEVGRGIFTALTGI